MIRLYTAASLPEAHLVRGLLEQRGIVAHVFHENAQGGVGELPVTLPEVWLEREGDLARAGDVVRDFEASAGTSGAPAACPQCGDENPSSFEICWRCGVPLDA